MAFLKGVYAQKGKGRGKGKGSVENLSSCNADTSKMTRTASSADITVNEGGFVKG